MSGGRLRAIASALALVAVLTVLSTATLAAVTRYGEHPSAGSSELTGSTQPPTPEVPEHVFPDGQFLYGDAADNVVWEVPSQDSGWQPAGGDEYIFDDEDGAFAVGMRDGAVLHEGICGDEKFTNRALTGIVEPAADDTVELREANRELAVEWLKWASLTDDDTYLDTSGPEQRDVQLADGTPAVLASGTADQQPAGACTADRIAIDLLSFDSGRGRTTVILVRDLGGVDRRLSDADAERILGTVRLQRPE